MITTDELKVQLADYGTAVKDLEEALPQLGFRTLIFDEVQELRHSGTEKYSAASLAAARGAAARALCPADVEARRDEPAEGPLARLFYDI